MSNFRVKDVKFGRPVATKDRLPTETEVVGEGIILAWSHQHYKWEKHHVMALEAWPDAYPFWRRIFP